MKGIVITTHKSTELFYNDLMRSLFGCKYPVVTVYNTEEKNEYEKSGLKVGMEIFDEFIYLHDTVLIKKMELFDKLFEHEGMISISPGFLMYLGKYISSTLKQHELPTVTKKSEAIDMEFWIGRTFPSPCFDVKFVDGNHRFEEKHGRMNMVLENEYLIKMKAIWDRSMIKD